MRAHSPRQAELVQRVEHVRMQKQSVAYELAQVAPVVLWRGLRLADPGAGAARAGHAAAHADACQAAQGPPAQQSVEVIPRLPRRTHAPQHRQADRRRAPGQAR